MGLTRGSSCGIGGAPIWGSPGSLVELGREGKFTMVLSARAFVGPGHFPFLFPRELSDER